MITQDDGAPSKSGLPSVRSPVRTAGQTRSTGKRRAIFDAATSLFLQQGYQGTSMDEIATAAGVSKQTVYKQFADKKQLFNDIVVGIADRAERIVGTLEKLFDEVVDLEPGLALLAQRYAASVVDPQVLQLRRLIISEADRFPDLAEIYFENAPGRGLDAIANGLELLSERGLLRVDDPIIAADHFAYLVLGPIIDKALFHPHAKVSDADVAHYARAGVLVFIAAYGLQPQ